MKKANHRRLSYEQKDNIVIQCLAELTEPPKFEVLVEEDLGPEEFLTFEEQCWSEEIEMGYLGWGEYGILIISEDRSMWLLVTAHYGQILNPTVQFRNDKYKFSYPADVRIYDAIKRLIRRFPEIIAQERHILRII